MQVNDSSRFKGQRTTSYPLLGRSTKLCGKVVDVGGGGDEELEAMLKIRKTYFCVE